MGEFIPYFNEAQGGGGVLYTTSSSQCDIALAYKDVKVANQEYLYPHQANWFHQGYRTKLEEESRNESSPHHQIAEHVAPLLARCTHNPPVSHKPQVKFKETISIMLSIVTGFGIVERL